MKKFYLESGPTQMLVNAVDLEGAGIWVFHQAMEKVIDLGSQVNPINVAGHARLVFGESMFLSHRGFGGHDAGILSTAIVSDLWLKLMKAGEILCDFSVEGDL